jgi:ribosome modulation factor
MSNYGDLSPYLQGLYASRNAQSLEDCPYMSGSDEEQRWCEGWMKASGCPHSDSEEPQDRNGSLSHPSNTMSDATI